MARTCRFTFGDRSGAAEWIYDGEQLTLTPEGGGVLSVALKELAGISGDGYTLDLVVPGGGPGGTGDHLILARLGAEGPTLSEALRREWLTARAKVLRLGGSGEGKRFYGRATGLAPTGASAVAGAEPFQALLFEDVLVVACDGKDLQPIFLALIEAVAFDEPSYSIQLRHWPNQEIVFSKMAGQTDEFLQAVQGNRSLLAKESAAQLTVALPGLPAGGRAALAGIWLPGRLMRLDAMDALCPGFASGFKDSWLPRLARPEEGRYLLSRAVKAAGGAWLGFTRGDAGTAGGDESPGDAGYGTEAGNSSDSGPATSVDGVPGDVLGGASGAAPEGDSQGLPEGEQPAWLLARLEEAWFLEALSMGSRATYGFKGGEEVPVLVSQLLCAPQFSREALYNPLEQLTGDNAALAIPAVHLDFLVELRRCFAGRVIHQGADGWRKGVERLGGGSE
jgi:hypothetical protein